MFDSPWNLRTPTTGDRGIPTTSALLLDFTFQVKITCNVGGASDILECTLQDGWSPWWASGQNWKEKTMHTRHGRAVSRTENPLSSATLNWLLRIPPHCDSRSHCRSLKQARKTYNLFPLLLGNKVTFSVRGFSNSAAMDFWKNSVIYPNPQSTICFRNNLFNNLFTLFNQELQIDNILAAQWTHSICD